jgi:hypothetical protein
MVGISFVDLNMTLVGKLTHLTESDLKQVDPKAMRLRKRYGLKSLVDRGNFSNALPLVVATGRAQQTIN